MKLKPFQFGIIHLMWLALIVAVLVRFPTSVAATAGLGVGMLVAYGVVLSAVMALEGLYRRWLWKAFPKLNRQHEGHFAVLKSLSRNLFVVLCGCALMRFPAIATVFYVAVALVAVVGLSRMLRGTEPFRLDPPDPSSARHTNEYDLS